LYDRLVQMITNFTLLPFYQTPVKITPSRNRQAMLGEQAIPYYYSYPDIYRYWNYDACRKQRAAQLPAYFRLNRLENKRGYDLIPRIDWTDFFRVEGHLGLPLTTAIDRIKQYKDDFNLAFDLVAVRVGAGIEDANLLQGYFDDLEVEFDLIKADWQQKYDRAKQTFIENPNILKILAKFQEYFFQYSDLTKIDPGLMVNELLQAAQNSGNYEFRLVDREPNTLQLVLNILRADPFRTALVTLPTGGNQIQRATRFVIADLDFQTQNKAHIQQIFANEFTADTTTLRLETDDSNNLRFLIDNGQTDIELVGRDEDLPNLLIRLEDETPYNIDTLLDRYHDFDALFAFLQYFGINPGDAAKLVSYYEFRALFHRYLLRLTSVKKMQLLTEYAKHHRGLDHLGGVPNGGTLVLVYTSDLAVIENLIASDAALIQTSSQQVETIKLQAQFPLDRVLQGQKLTSITSDRIDQNIVIADFCLPYLCCSPYSSLDYIVSKPKPFISLPKPVYCEGDTNIYDFILDPPGGLLKGGDGIVDHQGKYAFQPSAIDTDVTEPTNLTFFYVVDAIGSSYSILLLPHADVTLSIRSTENTICVLPGEPNPIALIGNPSGGKFKLSIDNSPAQDIIVSDDSRFDFGSIAFPADKENLNLRFIYTVPNTDDYCAGTSDPIELVIIRKPIAQINYDSNGSLIYGEDCSIIGRQIEFNNNGSNGDTYEWKLNDSDEVAGTANRILLDIYYYNRSVLSKITLIARKSYPGERFCQSQKTVTIELSPLNPNWNFDNQALKTKTNADGTIQVILCRINNPNPRQESITVEQAGGTWSLFDSLTVTPVSNESPCEQRKQYTLDFTDTPAGIYTLTYTLPDGSSLAKQVEIIVIPLGNFEFRTSQNLETPDNFFINIPFHQPQHPELTYTWTITIGDNTPIITQAERNEFSYGQFNPGDPISVVMEIKDPNGYCISTSESQNSQVPMQVISFELFDPTNSNLINNQFIENGASIFINGVGEINLNIRAVTLPSKVGSVVFILQPEPLNPSLKPDNQSPYDLYRNDDDSPAVGWRPTVGTYTISATPCQLPDGQGNKGESLTVIFNLPEQIG
jgi:hypothetical protein